MSLLNALSTAGNEASAIGDAALTEAEKPVPIMARVAEPPPVEKASFTPPAQSYRGTLAQLIDAIDGQESGHGANTQTSVTGARGRMQIQPATFAQYARPGEEIDNAAHNAAVGKRIIADLWERSGGDPARVAVGYFSGPGNMAPLGSDTPWKRNAADPTGKTTASYVSDVLKRIGLMPGSDT